MRITRKLLLGMFILTFAFVTACSSSNKGNSEGSATPSPSPSPSSSQTSSPSAEPSATPEPTLNMNGETIKILQHTTPPTAGTVQGDMQLERIKEIEKKYNVKIEYVNIPWGEGATMITNSGLSGEPVGDIVLMDYYHAVPLIKENLLKPVDDLFDFSDPKWPKNVKEFGSFKGVTYGFNSIVNAGAGIYYNKTMFKEQGLTDLHELVDKDQWNWDTFLDITKKATKDTDGDGVTDQWGFTNHAGFLTKLFTYSNNGKFVDQKDGKFVFTNDDPNMIEALYFIKDLFTVHKVAAPNVDDGQDYQHSQDLFNTGKAAMVTGEVWEGEGRAALPFEQGFVPFPKGPKATEFKTGIENYTAYWMPANAKHPKEVAQIWEDMILWDQLDNIKRGEAEKQNVADEKDVESLMLASTYMDRIYIPIGYAHYAIASAIINKGETPESQLEAVKQQAQQELDNAMN